MQQRGHALARELPRGPQFATDQGANSHVNYILYEGSGVAAAAANRLPSTRYSRGSARRSEPAHSFPACDRCARSAKLAYVGNNLRRAGIRRGLLRHGGLRRSGPAIDVPIPNPVQLFAITSDTSTSATSPGTMTYFRLDTPTTSATVTIRFAPPGGGAFAANLRPQMAVFRLPTGQ